MSGCLANSIFDKKPSRLHNTLVNIYGDDEAGLKRAATEYFYFESDSFKEDLESAKKRNVWCMGNDFKTNRLKLPMLETILQDKLNGPGKYLLGCCVFHSGEFLRALSDFGFFDRFLFYTNGFAPGVFPGYNNNYNYDFSEHLYPTLANHFGGNVEGMASWNPRLNEWDGNFKKYPIRWKPVLKISEEFEGAIYHPLKEFSHPIRQLQRMKKNV